MLINSLKSRRDAEEGFTLIELMVVVLIIAILIAIAIPTFLGARERAQDRAAQSDLRNGLTAEKVYYTDAEAYTTTVADLQDHRAFARLGYRTERDGFGGYRPAGRLPLADLQVGHGVLAG